MATIVAYVAAFYKGMEPVLSVQDRTVLTIIPSTAAPRASLRPMAYTSRRAERPAFTPARLRRTGDAVEAQHQRSHIRALFRRLTEHLPLRVRHGLLRKAELLGLLLLQLEFVLRKLADEHTLVFPAIVILHE
jgi:hypothetical protein